MAGWCHPVPNAQPRRATSQPACTPRHHGGCQEPPQTRWVLPLPSCSVGLWGQGQLGAAPAEGVEPSRVWREPGTNPAPAGKELPEQQPKICL